MNLIDTHTHIFLEDFDEDRDFIIERALSQKINKLFLPNIDSSSIEKLIELPAKYPKICYPMIGLHPTSVKDNYREELEMVSQYLENHKFYGIGETGIDLYWDKTHLNEQKEAFRFQIDLAKKYNLPIIIHVRDSFGEVFELVDELNDSKLKGIFHCFSGTLEQAHKIIDYGGFKLGIGGVVTFKKAGLDQIVSKISPEHLVLETDSPFLAPDPYRGKRNEPSYLMKIAQKIAEIHHTSVEQIAEITSKNALEIFKMNLEE